MSFVMKVHTHNHADTGVHRPAWGYPIGLVVALLRRLRHRRELNHLLSLPDYQLKDVGLQRHDIQRAVTKPLWRA